MVCKPVSATGQKCMLLTDILFIVLDRNQSKDYKHRTRDKMYLYLIVEEPASTDC